MASSRIISHSPPNLHRQSSPFDTVKPLPPQNLNLPPKRHRNLRIHTSLRSSSHSNNDLNDTVELRTNSVSAVSNDVVSKDPISLPRPLSSNQSSTAVSDGSRLRVAYQGVRGAYSESAAQKAYPNCEAVPCEQFDTAFE
ncbi:arogenate dehydratase/prephenate dehydratase chloroplastic-like, partial [Trifolium pratense]